MTISRYNKLGSDDKVRDGRPRDMEERVLDAAERLLARGGGFSMRDLAGEAGVSFATPFNRFGGKGAILWALSARRIDAMRERLDGQALAGDAIGRVLAAVDVAVAVMLEAPAVNRAVMAAIGAPDEEDGAGRGGVGAAGSVLANSGAFWAGALGEGDGLAPDARMAASAALPDLLAVAFRGALSFWSAGEIPDPDLRHRARAAAASVLLGFAGRDGRAGLLGLLALPGAPALYP